MKPIPVAVLLLGVLSACHPRTGQIPTPGPALRNLPRLADPAPVAAAVELRNSDPARALQLLQQTWADAVTAHDPRLAAFALDRAGDVVMGLGARWNRDLPVLDESARAQLDGCGVADAYYQRAWQLVADSGEARVIGRMAHDVGWALEQCGHPYGARRWYQLALEQRLSAGDALGVRFSANNLGRILPGPRRARLELYLLAAEGARIAGDAQGERKVHTNIARLWFYSDDTGWLEPSDSGIDAYASGPPRGEARVRFLHHLGAALEAAGRAEESSVVVCEGFGIDEFDCSTWLDGKPEELFPEPPSPGAR